MDLPRFFRYLLQSLISQKLKMVGTQIKKFQKELLLNIYHTSPIHHLLEIKAFKWAAVTLAPTPWGKCDSWQTFFRTLKKKLFKNGITLKLLLPTKMFPKFIFPKSQIRSSKNNRERKW
jgi:hypothetical protein